MASNTEYLDSLVNSKDEIEKSLKNKGINLEGKLKYSQVSGYIDAIVQEGSGGGAKIIVTAPDYEGETLTAKLGENELTETVVEGQAIFNVNIEGLWTISAEDGNSIEIEVAYEFKETLKKFNIYTYVVDNDEADPYNRVTYRDDALGLKPAKMEDGYFDWGDWKDKFFNEKNHVYRIKADGTIVGQCKDDDYSQFVDGTSSGITGSGHTDNFMASIPTCWIWRRMEGNKSVVSISDVQVDDNYKAYAHMNEDGKVQDFIYWGAFRGCTISNKLRSLSGQKLTSTISASDEITRATANGNRWFTLDWSDWQLMIDLLTLMFKSTDMKKSLGKGFSEYGESDKDYSINSGTLNTKGAFWGSQSSNIRMKAFHCEDLWGNLYIRIGGCVSANGEVKVKMVRPYNLTGNGYMTLSPVPKTAAGLWSKRYTNEYGTYPIELNGSNTTYECHSATQIYVNNNYYPFIGGFFNNKDEGLFSLYLNYDSNLTLLYIGTSLCYK